MMFDLLWLPHYASQHLVIYKFRPWHYVQCSANPPFAGMFGSSFTSDLQYLLTEVLVLILPSVQALCVLFEALK